MLFFLKVLIPYIKENFDIFNFNLTNEEMNEFNKMGKTKRFFILPLKKTRRNVS